MSDEEPAVIWRERERPGLAVGDKRPRDRGAVDVDLINRMLPLFGVVNVRRRSPIGDKNV